MSRQYNYAEIKECAMCNSYFTARNATTKRCDKCKPIYVKYIGHHARQCHFLAIRRRGSSRRRSVGRNFGAEIRKIKSKLYASSKIQGVF